MQITKKECWNDGMLLKRQDFKQLHFSNFPLFHYSIIPLFQVNIINISFGVYFTKFSKLLSSQFVAIGF